MSCVRRMFSKFDIEKAYDHFNWDVLVYLLGRMGLVDNWRLDILLGINCTLLGASEWSSLRFL